MSVPLVLLHPFPFDRRFFDEPVLPGVRVHLVDLPGFGGSSLPTAEPDLSLLADAVLAHLDAAGVGRSVIGGVSLGGYVTLDLLARFPDRFAGAVLIDTKADADTPEILQRRADTAAAADQGELAAPRDTVDSLVAAGCPESVRERLAAVAADQPAATVAWTSRAMAARPARFDALTAFTGPVLIIVGEEDAVTDPAAAERMVEAAADPELRVIPAAGHLAAAERPEDFSSAVAGWWTRVAPH